MNFGPTAQNADGLVFPTRLMVKQRGVYVERWYGQNSARDRPDRF